jgi:hypothetical protein
MRPVLIVGALISALAAVSPPASAQERPRCPEGRAFNGECVNPGRAEAMRRSAVAQTQIRLSYTAPPWLPAYDRGLYIAKNFHEMNNIFFPPLTTRNTSLKP